MKKYFLTRLALALPVILLVSVFSFALVFLAPGDPAAQYRTLEMTDEEYEQLKTELGYNDPVIVQYGRWMGKVLQGDFGVSTSSHTGVWPLIKAKLPATVGLMAASIVFSLLVSIPLGMLAGYFENSWFDRITNGLHYVAISIPSFWFAIMLIILFSLNLGWLPSSGMRTTGVHTFWDLSRHAIMPVLVASTNSIASAILTESSLSYLGFGISIPNPSWGGMLEGAQTYILTHPSLAVYPGVCILLTVLCFNVLGNGFRRRFSPNSGR